MDKKGKPVNIVYDNEKKVYDAALRPYATNLSAPKITIIDNSGWKNENLHKINKYIETRYNELKEQYNRLIKQYECNKLLYQAKFSFEPTIGETYHLYKDKDEESFLSIIAPKECNFEHLGSFRLNADKMWESIQI
ncbi:DUF2452 domain-containing protein [Aquimarina celericrescens]|uniref:DUF2452 domain-containing protein n=1 Tax=Aquimarina celericrescens TaxID=1964542 RepID=A0ABW5AZV5_9FLAO|nr:DUF2452 domain-containing protein [Aquimarina celericrescens]